jgi:DNA-binding HxlR family transcriptional regulator
VGRGVDVVGETWALLIVRDAVHGITRFDDLRRRYEERPPRDEYVLTDRGRELAAVVLALGGWWNHDVPPGERPVVIVDGETGEEVDPVVVDRRTGRPIEWPRHRFAAGPTASDPVRDLIATSDPDRAAS